jgi:SAM-dependent methyltransferase
VLEHVPDLTRMNSEVRRVLKPGGYAIHVMPTHAQRFWTTLTSFPDAFVCLCASIPDMLPHAAPKGAELKRLGGAWYRGVRAVGGRIFQRRHGERGNIISETWLFHPSWWRRNFQDNGFELVHDEPMGLFYTGNMLLGTKLGLGTPESLAYTLGSACHLFKVRPS